MSALESYRAMLAGTLSESQRSALQVATAHAGELLVAPCLQCGMAIPVSRVLAVAGETFCDDRCAWEYRAPMRP